MWRLRLSTPGSHQLLYALGGYVLVLEVYGVNAMYKRSGLATVKVAFTIFLQINLIKNILMILLCVE